MLGLVQGAAEVFPVSSSAQLALLPWLAGWQQPDDRTRFAAGLHLGSAAGMALALRDDVRSLTPHDVRRIALSSAPAALAGLLLQGVVERRLGRPGPTAALLAISGAGLWMADSRAGNDRCPVDARATRKGGQSSHRGMVAASLAQVLALAPGVSRTGATLTALRARGVPRDEALRASLLMSLPVTAGAAGLTAVRGGSVPPLLPTALAGLSAYVTARRVRPSRGFVVASVAYRLGVAAAVAAKLRKEQG
ncbi:MAG: undecaprenyl-diphosphate phosphatase [Actinomycetota bacterium]|nr:undecaprenyl-diphosphate phosphatase [Actinomycetota bacterium]